MKGDNFGDRDVGTRAVEYMPWSLALQKGRRKGWREKERRREGSEKEGREERKDESREEIEKWMEERKEEKRKKRKVRREEEKKGGSKKKGAEWMKDCFHSLMGIPNLEHSSHLKRFYLSNPSLGLLWLSPLP